ncbi:hypothetical protein [Nostoc sp. NMS4]|nr:hypothetical protein [Nostoc sp. NMS4]MBN3925628.1 hypothetical protein [Nostoc sp. NMS4]
MQFWATLPHHYTISFLDPPLNAIARVFSLRSHIYQIYLSGGMQTSFFS